MKKVLLIGLVALIGSVNFSMADDAEKSEAVEDKRVSTSAKVTVVDGLTKLTNLIESDMKKSKLAVLAMATLPEPLNLIAGLSVMYPKIALAISLSVLGEITQKTASGVWSISKSVGSVAYNTGKNVLSSTWHYMVGNNRASDKEPKEEFSKLDKDIKQDSDSIEDFFEEHIADKGSDEVVPNEDSRSVSKVASTLGVRKVLSKVEPDIRASKLATAAMDQLPEPLNLMTALAIVYPEKAISVSIGLSMYYGKSAGSGAWGFSKNVASNVGSTIWDAGTSTYHAGKHAMNKLWGYLLGSDSSSHTESSEHDLSVELPTEIKDNSELLNKFLDRNVSE